MKIVGIGFGILSIILCALGVSSMTAVQNYGSIASLQAQTNEMLLAIFLVLLALVSSVFSATFLVLGSRLKHVAAEKMSSNLSIHSDGKIDNSSKVEAEEKEIPMPLVVAGIILLTILPVLVLNLYF